MTEFLNFDPDDDWDEDEDYEDDDVEEGYVPSDPDSVGTFINKVER